MECLLLGHPQAPTSPNLGDHGPARLRQLTNRLAGPGRWSARAVARPTIPHVRRVGPHGSRGDGRCIPMFPLGRSAAEHVPSLHVVDAPPYLQLVGIDWPARPSSASAHRAGQTRWVAEDTDVGGQVGPPDPRRARSKREIRTTQRWEPTRVRVTTARRGPLSPRSSRRNGPIPNPPRTRRRGGRHVDVRCRVS